MAFGGDGAPLTPAFHYGFLRNEDESRAILNLGGIANITHLGKKESKVIGFDIGPANCLMDLWIQYKKDLKYDKNGDWAASGNVHQPLLESLIHEDYFSIVPPKSTGKELFNLSWLKLHLSKFPSISDCDVAATLLELTAVTIKGGVLQYMKSVTHIYCCGGGAYNLFLLQRLSILLPEVQIDITDSLGIPVQWVEAIAFAWFAKKRIEKQSANLPSVTGASKKTILGGLYEIARD